MLDSCPHVADSLGEGLGNSIDKCIRTWTLGTKKEMRRKVDEGGDNACWRIWATLACSLCKISREWKKNAKAGREYIVCLQGGAEVPEIGMSKLRGAECILRMLLRRWL